MIDSSLVKPPVPTFAGIEAATVSMARTPASTLFVVYNFFILSSSSLKKYKNKTHPNSYNYLVTA
jgi:hypothetical protein